MDALVFYGGVVFCLGVYFYMLIFRTKDFIELAKADEERKKARAERFGKAANVGLDLFKTVMKK